MQSKAGTTSAVFCGKLLINHAVKTSDTSLSTVQEQFRLENLEICQVGEVLYIFCNGSSDYSSKSAFNVFEYIFSQIYKEYCIKFT